ncbi:MAG: thiamine phosphate synthase [Bacteroidales bacterium]|nr:thiamine phosphate synthase [Bacteroidales bacterium]
MLQIRLTPNENYSIAEMAQMAIEGGCGWLQVDAAEIDDANLRELGKELVPLCRETGTMLTLENNVEMARELGVHGVFLTGDRNPVAVREELGPEAIIGTYNASADAAISMDRADIDYLIIPSKVEDEVAAKIIADTRKAGASIPFVALSGRAPMSADGFAKILGLGFAGILAGSEVFKAEDPVAHIEKLIATLRKEE